MTRLARAIAALAAVTALAVSATPTVLGADHGVDIAGFAFAPQSITISVGDSVTWANSDARSHTATADDGSFDTGTITSSTPATVTFATAGTFAYHCKIHPEMTATIVVQDAVTAPATDTLAAEPGAPSPSPSWIALVAAAIAGVLGAARRFRPRSDRR
ncbi:MAG TPA: plastocyanin/azurin family copper-binding protein [Candidatus Limnocylindrales bacterium]|nr:plastocyanin/azurin family copper-binding protein [Candidatus Limnocylindrales bacterium]